MKESSPMVPMRTQDAEPQADTLHPALFPAKRADSTSRLSSTTAVALAVLVLGVAGFRNPDRIHREPVPLPDTLVVAPMLLYPQPLATPTPATPRLEEPSEPSGGEKTPPPPTPTPPVVLPTRISISPGGYSTLPTLPAFQQPAPLGLGSANPPTQPVPLDRHAKNGGSYPAPKYPPAADLQKLEGEVLLWIRVDPTGRILNVEVKRTSGHSLLDRAAVETVRKHWRFPAGPERLYEWPCAFLVPRSPGSNPQ